MAPPLPSGERAGERGAAVAPPPPAPTPESESFAGLADDPPPAPLMPPLPGEPGAPPGPSASPDGARIDSTDQHHLFYEAAPTHRPRVTAEWLLQEKKRQPYRYLWLAGAVGLLVAGGVAFSAWRVQRVKEWPPEAVKAAPRAAPAPQTVVMPAERVQGEAPAPALAPVELPPDQPLQQKGGQGAPRGVGGEAGFESVGGVAGGGDVREKLRQRNLTIGKKDKKLLDLLEKKGDAAPAPAGAVARTELDSGRAALDEDAVRSTMAGNSAAYGACVTRAVKEDPKLRVDGRRATLMLTIKASGVVQSAWIAEADLDKSALGRCLVQAARRMIFPAFSGDPVDVSVPLALSATL